MGEEEPVKEEGLVAPLHPQHETEEKFQIEQKAWKEAEVSKLRVMKGAEGVKIWKEGGKEKKEARW